MSLGEMLEQEESQSSLIKDGEGIAIPKRATKAELLQVIKEKEADIKSLHAEIDKLEKYAALQEGADATKALHTAFMNSGFSDEQAFKLVELMMGSIIKSNAHLFMMR